MTAVAVTLLRLPLTRLSSHLRSLPSHPPLPPPRLRLSASYRLLSSLLVPGHGLAVAAAVAEAVAAPDEEEVEATEEKQQQQEEAPPSFVLPRLPRPKLDVKERKELASYAHGLGKKLKSQQVGKGGVTPSLVSAFTDNLETNELLKMNGGDNGGDDEATRREHLLRLAQMGHQAAVLGYFGNLYSETYLNKQPRRIPQQTGYEWVMENLGRTKSCYKMFRMNPDVFEGLHTLLVSNYGLQSTRNMTSVESLAMFLWMVGAPQSISQVENIFARSTETIHRKFMEVLHCVYYLGRDNIKPTDSSFTSVHPRIRDPRFWPHFKDAIGAIDGSHIPVEVPAEEIVNHTGRHGYTSQNMMAICDFDMRFTFAVAGWPSSAHDTWILNRSIEKYAHKFPFPPHGKYYLVDSGYPNRTGYLAPYKGQTYHLPEFRRRGQPSGKKEVFNHAHSSLRNVIERSFGVLKMKWRMLRSVPSYSMKTQKKIILACMALHNYIRDTKLRDKEFDRCDMDENYIPGVQHGAAPLVGDTAPEALDEGDMNIKRERIATSLISARGG